MFEPSEPNSAVAARVCGLIPPLWDLPNYVAVNPFLGFASRPFVEAARKVGDALDARILPGMEHYEERRRAGAVGLDDLGRAALRSGLDPDKIEEIATGRAVAPRRRTRRALTFAERCDRTHGTDWNDAVIRQAARWCAVYASGGGAAWKLPVDSAGLYASWRDAASIDRTLEIAGLAGWRDWIAALPERADEVIEYGLARLDILAEDREAYLYRLLGGLYGWASYFRRASWEAGSTEPGDVLELLAVRLAADAAVAALAYPHPEPSPWSLEPAVDDEAVRLVFQDAVEDAFARSLLIALAPPPGPEPRPRPDVQAVFCIDVRSEPFRRHLETAAPTVETRGFAGFFGVSLDWQGSARCPVLLKPAVGVETDDASATLPPGTLKTLQTAPAAAFSFVELLGLGYGLRLVGDALAAFAKPETPEASTEFRLALAPEKQVDLAAGILKNLGLRTSFARLILLCGHAGRSANNPHAAGLDCGACGGHGGAVNARAAAAVLNDPIVREGLLARGWEIPPDTHFLPGVHDTTLDEVELLDLDQLPSSHRGDVERLRGWLDEAGEQTRRERAASLGLDDVPPSLLDRVLRRRARDWSEVRPEWALARNAAFIAARRDRTRGVDLEGRAFLHEYDAETDPDDSILTLILSAPMVVASWINLQYFASTVDNRVFGCGTKTIHNRVGSLGVVLGNGGDLRTGLAWQSVYSPDGRPRHEPLRLQVVVEADLDRIERVLAAKPGVRDLVDNGWVRLYALDPSGDAAWLRVPAQGWERVVAETPAEVISSFELDEFASAAARCAS